VRVGPNWAPVYGYLYCLKIIWRVKPHPRVFSKYVVEVHSPLLALSPTQGLCQLIKLTEHKTKFVMNLNICKT
jgi:hypothetical protein